MAPSVVTSALKTAVLTSRVLEKLGYDVEPSYQEERVDIVQNIIFRDPDKLIRFTRGIQQGSPIDSNAIVEAWDMPWLSRSSGYGQWFVYTGFFY